MNETLCFASGLIVGFLAAALIFTSKQSVEVTHKIDRPRRIEGDEWKDCDP